MFLLADYNTGDVIRPATQAEVSQFANDGHVIEIDRFQYVVIEVAEPAWTSCRECGVRLSGGIFCGPCAKLEAAALRYEMGLA